MRVLDRSGLGSLLTLVVYLLSGCSAEQAPMPSPSPPSAAAPESNLLRNPDFLQGTSGWDATRDAAGASVALAYDQAGFVTLEVGPSDGPQTAGWVQALGVQPGASYRASYRVHTEKLVGRAAMRLSFYDAAGGLLWETGGAPAGRDTPWVTRAWRCRAPPGAALARVWLGVEAAGSGRAAFAEPCLAADDAPPARALIVDYEQVVGQVRSFQQVNYGPLGSAPAGLLEHNRGRPHLAAVSIDVTAVFPNPWADPADPAGYHFHTSDAALAAADAAGATILCRLVDGPAVTGRRTGAPLWGQVAQHIAMHYNDGWAGGYRYDIRYWEVRCDPGQLGSRGPLAGSYYGLLAAAIGAFQAFDPGLKVGGPGLAGTAHEPFLEGMLAYLAERELRPGFLSWQVDGDGAPWAVAVAEADVERLLDRHGLAGTEVIVSDWGAATTAGWDAEGSAREAAQLVAGAAGWQGTRLSLAFRSWPGTEAAPGLLAAGGGLSPLGRAFLLMGGFEDTPRRLAVQGGDELGYALLAGKSGDGKLVQVAIADTGSGSEEYRLALAGFPPGFHYVVREISGGCAGEVVAYGSDAGLTGGVLALPWRSPAVHWIEISWDE